MPKITNSDNNIDAIQETSNSIKFGKAGYNFGVIGLVLGALFWILESAIHAFLFNEGTFLQQLIEPAVNEIWMRSLLAFILAGLGFSIDIIIKKT